jgi:hypothetical protein
MVNKNEKETKGAWIVHHARKISMDVGASAEYSVLDEAGKAADLLMRLGATDEATLQKAEVAAIASAANLNPRTELPHYLKLLAEKRLIDTSQDEVQVLGINTRGVLGHASDIFDAGDPNAREMAAIELGEITSQAPLLLADATEFVSDKFKMKKSESSEFIRLSSPT